MRFGTEQFAEEAAALRLGGQTQISSEAAVRLLAQIAHERKPGVNVFINYVYYGHLPATTSQEGTTIVGGIPDAYAIPKFGTTGSKSSVTTAWEFVDAYRTLAPPLGQKAANSRY